MKMALFSSNKIFKFSLKEIIKNIRQGKKDLSFEIKTVNVK